MIDLHRIRIDLIALGLLAVTVFMALALFSFDPADPPGQTVFPLNETVNNLCGDVGATLADRMLQAFGIGAFVLLLLLLAIDLQLFARECEIDWRLRAVGMLFALTGACVALQNFGPTLHLSPIVGNGGYLGAHVSLLLDQHVSMTGSLILTASFIGAGLLLTTDSQTFQMAGRIVSFPARTVRSTRSFFQSAVSNTRASLVALKERTPKKRTKAEQPTPQPDQDPEGEPEQESLDNEAPTEETTDEELNDDSSEEISKLPFRVNPPATAVSDRQEVKAQLESSSLSDAGEFELPDRDILEDPEDFPYELLAKKAQIAAATLEKTFHEFGLNISVVEIDTGPVITQFELELEAGLRLSKVTALADDLAIALRVPSVRVVSPIPGKNTVGIEVPNEKQVMVRLRELIDSTPEELEKKRIPLYLGKDVSGRPLVVDMTKMPHLLIAGRTGTGKSVCLNTLILSILMTRKPDDVKMLMIDPKMVELSPYRRVPHLMHPVITDMKKAEAVLAWAVDKMEERYDLLARCGVRHLDSYNKLGLRKVLERLDIDTTDEEAESIPGKMPYIVIVADEMADMMMTSGKDVEGHIIRLAQKSRAVGIHLVLATQKPTVDVITGLIKSNLPARVSFQVASRTDSRVVLDEMGAERLLGNGDMLYLAPGTSNVTRAQGTYVSDDEINGVIDFFGDEEPEYNIELSRIGSSSGTGGGPAEAPRNRDDVYDQAIEVVIREGRGSVSLLQRCLGIGYGRAARLIDYMAEDGIVGDYNGSQAREVLYTMEQWEAVQAGEEL